MSIVVRTCGILFNKDKKSKPFVVCKIGKEKKSGHVYTAQGPKLQLNDTLVIPFNHKEHDKMKVIIRNDGSGDDKIGKAVVHLHQFYERPNCTKNEQLEIISKKGKPVAKIYLMIEYQGKPHHQHKHSPKHHQHKHHQHKHSPKHHDPKHHDPKHHDHHDPKHHGQQNQGFIQTPPCNINNFIAGWDKPQPNQQQFPPNNPNFNPTNMGGGFMPPPPNIQPQFQPNQQQQQQQPLIVNFIIKVIEANLNKDLDTFSKMDPYCVLKIGRNKQKTKTIKGGGKNPHFNEMIKFNNIRQGVLNVALFDHDPTSDDLIGEGVVNLGEVVTLKGAVKNQYVDLIRNGKPVGRLNIAINAEPSNPNF